MATVQSHKGYRGYLNQRPHFCGCESEFFLLRFFADGVVLFGQESHIRNLHRNPFRYQLSFLEIQNSLVYNLNLLF